MPYLLDTNIVAMLDPRRRDRESALIAWLERNGAGVFLSVMTIAEMDTGVLKLRRARKTSRADQLAGLMASILTDFGDRVLPLDLETARHVARLAEATHRQPVALADLIIAATAVRHGLVLLTRNLKEIGRLGIGARDPLVELPPDD
jgi:predicted nucleic acid-binding protein